MLLRKMRWLSAGLLATVAMLAAPSRSKAESLILIQELDGSNNVVNSASFTLATLPSSGSPYTPAGGSFASISLTVTSTSGVSSNINSISTTVGAKPSDSFDPSHSLQITVTDDAFLNATPGGVATATNDPGASSGISGGNNNLVGSTNIQSGTLAGADLASLALTPTASDTSPDGPSDPNSHANISNLPGQFAITQTMTLRAIPNAGQSIDLNSTFGGTLSSTILTSPAPVPAPAGLLLALAAVPMFGLRRALRRKVAETTV